MATSAATVFGTVELLEMILLGCTMEEITCARRINTFVQATIDGSQRLRQKVFLEAAPGGEKLVITDWRRRSTEVLLVVPSGDRTVRSGTYSLEIVTLNPLLEQCTRTASPTATRRWLHGSNFAIVEQDFLDRAPGVWQQMLITQPPARSLELVVVKTKGPRSGVFKSKAQTLGALREELLLLDRGRTLRPRPAESPANSISSVGISSRTAVMADNWRVAGGRINTARLAEVQAQTMK
ncbi:hypothetical protein TI39_contig4195g00021 [Zymoseptoria brevis]|uniref:Uncharacterized protein n=1 Tax=Zymoseptoria brevis TaxID=1047168 RepID=A0A0F4GAP3_9PEZI|nr:hypothetical protein TI39_contig4195g00021 [Zymoseptoria brevis]